VIEVASASSSEEVNVSIGSVSGNLVYNRVGFRLNVNVLPDQAG
jgi:hypothetical protein